MIVAIIGVTILLILGVFGFIHFMTIEHDKLSFKEAIELTELPIITFHHINDSGEDVAINFLIDTGANRSVLTEQMAELITHKPTEHTNTLCGIDGQDRVVTNTKIVLTYNGKNYEEVFQLSDMSSIFDKMKEDTGVRVHGILGDSFFRKYRYIIDFDAYMAYSKCRR